MARVKKQEHEKLTQSNISHVIELLNPEEGKPITKKEACEILHISYNTTRLNKIIEEHIERIAYVAERKKKNRGKPATEIEIRESVMGYLRAEPIADIAKYLYRSADFIKDILDRVGVPQRPISVEDKAGTDYIPEECVSEEFSEGEIAWSAIHHTTVEVGRELSVRYQETKKGLADTDYETKYGSRCYQVYVFENTDTDTVGGYFSYALAYDLGRLAHLEQYGINLEKI